RRKKLRQVVIDSRVSRREGVRGDIEGGESRSPSAREHLHQACARINLRAREGAEADEEDAGHNFRIAVMSSTAVAGAVTPAATSASIRDSWAFTVRSLRNGSNRRSSSMVHIHLTCCSPRRAAISPDADNRWRWSRTCDHRASMPSLCNAEQTITGGDQFGERGDRMCNAAPYCDAASLARIKLSPSALLTAIMSASSAPPF